MLKRYVYKYFNKILINHKKNYYINVTNTYRPYINVKSNYYFFKTTI